MERETPWLKSLLEELALSTSELTPEAKEPTYRGGEPLRHLKSREMRSF